MFPYLRVWTLTSSVLFLISSFFMAMFKSSENSLCPNSQPNKNVNHNDMLQLKRPYEALNPDCVMHSGVGKT